MVLAIKKNKKIEMTHAHTQAHSHDKLMHIKLSVNKMTLLQQQLHMLPHPRLG